MERAQQDNILQYADVTYLYCTLTSRISEGKVFVTHLYCTLTSRILGDKSIRYKYSLASTKQINNYLSHRIKYVSCTGKTVPKGTEQNQFAMLNNLINIVSQLFNRQYNSFISVPFISCVFWMTHKKRENICSHTRKINSITITNKPLLYEYILL